MPPPSLAAARKPDPSPRNEASVAAQTSPAPTKPSTPARAAAPDAQPAGIAGAAPGLSAADGLGDGGIGIGVPGGGGGQDGEGRGGEGEGRASLGHRLYSLQLQRRLQERLAQESALQASHYTCQLAVWIGPDGSFSQAHLQKATGPTGEAGVCDGLPALMSHLGRITDPPPAGLHQPVVLRVANRPGAAPALSADATSDPSRGQGLAARP